MIDGHPQQRGSALIITLITLAALAAAVAAVSVSVSTTANVSLQAASWQEALMAAEAGADTATACFGVALSEGSVGSPVPWNDTTNALSDVKTAATAWSGWVLDPTTSATPSPSATPRTLYYTKTLRSVSAGNTGLITVVKIESPTGWTDSGTGRQWYRIRATGTAGVAGPPRVGADKRDNDLHKINLSKMRSALSSFPQASLGSSGPQVSRSVELVLRPLKSGDWDRAITATSPTGGGSVNLGAGFTTDSWDSSNTAKYPGGHYDATKRQSNADLASNANGQYVEIGGSHLYGDVLCNGGTPKHTQNVTGTISTNFSVSGVLHYDTPTWADVNTNNGINGDLTMSGAGGTKTNPIRFSYVGVSLKGKTLTCTGGGYIEIYVKKDFAMTNAAQWIVNQNTNVTVYIGSQFSVDGTSTIANQDNNCANLSLRGITPKDGTHPQWSLNSVSDFAGTIWAPEIKLKISGSANYFGAVMVSIYDTGGTTAAGFHFDEALLNSGTSTPRYTVASWLEDVR